MVRNLSVECCKGGNIILLTIRLKTQLLNGSLAICKLVINLKDTVQVKRHLGAKAQALTERVVLKTNI